MKDNIFLENQKQLTLEEYMGYSETGRKNLGDQVPVSVYRLLEYSLREQLIEQFGRDEQIEIFRKAGYKAGIYFAKHYLDLELSVNEFVASLQARMAEFKIGVLRMEKLDQNTGKMVFTVSEDVDCSGLPVLGEAVCNYDEGFIAGILSVYRGKPYKAVEIDCWATGDRVCRFQAEIEEQNGNGEG